MPNTLCNFCHAPIPSAQGVDWNGKWFCSHDCLNFWLGGGTIILPARQHDKPDTPLFPGSPADVLQDTDEGGK